MKNNKKSNITKAPPKHNVSVSNDKIGSKATLQPEIPGTGEIPPYINASEADLVKTVTGIHVNATAPFFAIHRNEPYRIEKAELYTTIISALNYRKYCGDIFMVTDSVGSSYYHKLGIEAAWNGVQCTLQSDLEGIDAEMFWAAGKLLALRDMDAPVAVIDTDFMLWEKPRFGKSVIAAHREALTPDIYPPKEYFRTTNYTYPDSLCWNDFPLNTAFLYIPDQSFKQYYVCEAITFMKCANRVGDRLCYMVFAEQRLLPMLCRKWGITPDVLLDKSRLFEEQSRYSHVWGAKAAMRSDKVLEAYFVEKCKRRIRADYPEFAYLIDNIEHNWE